MDSRLIKSENIWHKVTIHSRFRMDNTRVVPARKHVLSILNLDCEAVTPPHMSSLSAARRGTGASKRRRVRMRVGL